MRESSKSRLPLSLALPSSPHLRAAHSHLSFDRDLLRTPRPNRRVLIFAASQVGLALFVLWLVFAPPTGSRDRNSLAYAVVPAVHESEKRDIDREVGAMAARPARLSVGADKRHFIFGYGSLMSSASRQRTGTTGVAWPARLHNYERAWGYRGSYMTAVAVKEVDGATVNGVLVEVEVSDLPQFDMREAGYHRVRVPRAHLTVLDSDHELPAESEAEVWVYAVHRFIFASHERPIVQSYVDVILTGALEWGLPFASEFVATTKGWVAPLPGDTEAHKAPLAVTCAPCVDIAPFEDNLIDRPLKQQRPRSPPVATSSAEKVGDEGEELGFRHKVVSHSFLQCYRALDGESSSRGPPACVWLDDRDIATPLYVRYLASPAVSEIDSVLSEILGTPLQRVQALEPTAVAP